jgi:hypothetical protein
MRTGVNVTLRHSLSCKWGGDATGIFQVRAKALAKYLTLHKTVPTNNC